MGSICLSSASILRCTPSSEIKSVLLIIPTALEVIFSTSLIFVNWKGGSRKHLLLTAEGWIYFALSLSELVRAIVPGVRNSVQLFQNFDIGIGVASFLPLFFYTFFLFLLTSNELVDALPKNIRNVAKLSLIIFLPAIIVFNEIASFVGVKIGTLPPLSSNNKTTSAVITLGFTSPHEELLWTFFTSTTLALLIVYQAAVFCFSFFRLGRAVVGQRRIESDGADKAHFINGVGWLCAALKLGALESVVGFAGGAFSVDITRRVMRMISRGCLCIGIVKGVDTVEDFRDVQRELKINSANQRRTRRSGIRHFISNPRLSTFRQLSPTAASFHATANGKESVGYTKNTAQASKNGGHYSTWSQRQSALLQNGLPGMQAFASVKEARSNQIVTVLYTGGTPRLHMRFSSLDGLDPVDIAEKFERQSRSQYLGSYQGKTKVELPYASEYAFSESESDLHAPEAHFHKDLAGSISYRDSMNSAPSVGPYEIIDARKLPQKVAMAQMYTPRSGNMQSSVTQADEIAFPEPIYQMSASTVQPAKPSQGRDTSKIKSVISVADTIQAVRELTSQFPGPPGISQLRPAENLNRPVPSKVAIRPPTPAGLVEQSAWEDDSRTSAQYLSGIPVPQVIGSPSQLSFNKTQPSSVGADENVYSGADTPQPKAGKVPVTPGGYRRMSTSSRYRSRGTSLQKPIDPVEDEFDLTSLQPSKTPIYAPVGMPLRQSLKLNTVLSPQQSKGPLTAAVIESPSTALSQITRLQEDVMDARIDPFLDFATALDTGKSKQFRPTLPPVLEPPSRRMSYIPAPERQMSRAEEKYSRIEQWVNTSANLAVVEHEIPVSPGMIATPTMTPTIVGTSVDGKLNDDKLNERAPPRENNLQNLHDRGPSIDALSIAWPKDPNAPTVERGRAPATAVSAVSATRPTLTRIATVGKVPSRTTPAPMHTHTVRGSMHLLPIVVPPRSGNLPQIEYETIESPVSRKVLKDSDVLDMEDNLSRISRQAAGKRF